LQNFSKGKLAWSKLIFPTQKKDKGVETEHRRTLGKGELKKDVFNWTNSLRRATQEEKGWGPVLPTKKKEE